MASRRDFLKQTAGVLSATYAHRALSQQRERNSSAADPMLRLAIVGTGQVAHAFLKQGVGNKRAQFVATCARTLESARARAAEYGINAWFDDYAAMYDAVRPDAVVIATPSAAHAAPTIEALERRIHVLCEKPMATTFKDCEAMVAAARKSGAIFLNMPFDALPEVRTALEYMNEATLGVFVGAEGQVLIEGHPRANWYYDGSIAGGVMLDSMIYPVSRLISMLGPARRVTGSVNTLIPQRVVGSQTVMSTIDDNVSLIVEWGGGQQAILRTLWGVSWDRLDFHIYCRKGAVVGELFSPRLIVQSPNRSIPGGELLTWNGHPHCYRIPVKTDLNPRPAALEHFIDCIRGLSEPMCGSEQQLHVHEILFKGYEAARTGKTQDLHTTFTPWHKLEQSFFDTRTRPI